MTNYWRNMFVALEKAKEFIKNGGSIDAIKAKYDISSEILATL